MRRPANILFIQLNFLLIWRYWKYSHWHRSTSWKIHKYLLNWRLGICYIVYTIQHRSDVYHTTPKRRCNRIIEMFRLGSTFPLIIQIGAGNDLGIVYKIVRLQSHWASVEEPMRKYDHCMMRHYLFLWLKMRVLTGRLWWTGSSNSFRENTYDSLHWGQLSTSSRYRSCGCFWHFLRTLPVKVLPQRGQSTSLRFLLQMQSVSTSDDPISVGDGWADDDWKRTGGIHVLLLLSSSGRLLFSVLLFSTFLSWRNPTGRPLFTLSW